MLAASDIRAAATVIKFKILIHIFTLLYSQDIMASPSPMIQQQYWQCNSLFRNQNGGSGDRRHYHNGGDDGQNGEWYAGSYAIGCWEYGAPVPMPLVTPYGYYYANTIIPPPHDQGTLFDRSVTPSNSLF